MHVLQYANKKETFNNHVIPLHVQVLSLSSVFSSLAFVSLVRLSSALCFFFFFFFYFSSTQTILNCARCR